MATQSEKVTFNSADGTTLAARLERPGGPVKAYAVFAHCFTCGKDVAAATRISRALAGHGFAVLRFDFTGLGNSDGDFANTDFSSNVADLVSAARFLEENYEAPALLVGHSLGGAAVITAARDIPSVRGVVTIGAPAEPLHVTRLFEGKIDDIKRDGVATVNLAGRRFRIKKEFLDDLDEHRPEDAIRAMKRPLLIFHAPHDAVVGIENARKIYEAALHPKSFVALDGADHLLSKKRDSRYVADTIATWADRYGEADDEAETKPHGLGEGEVNVAETGTPYTQAIHTAGHELTSDEPPTVGGADQGPTPYELLLAALGACTSMTLRMYANRKQWPLRHVEVRLSHSRIHATDCESCESETGKVDRIVKRLYVEGDLTEEMRQRLKEIADRCPVNRTLLAKEKDVVTEWG